MMRVLVASVLAVVLHLAAFATVAPHLRGAPAAGAGGEALVSLAPADPVLLALVAEWDRPPDLAPPVLAPPVWRRPDVPGATPDGPAPTASVPPAAAGTAATLAAPALDAPPETETAPPPPKAPDPAPAAKSKPKPKAPKPAVPAQKSAGSGGNTGAGVAGKAEAAATDAGNAAAKAEWGAAIRARIERRKAYPADARGASGRVTLRLVVNADGRLVSVGVARSSGVAALDRAAVQAVKSAGRFPKAPKGQAQASFSLPVSFAP